MDEYYVGIAGNETAEVELETRDAKPETVQVSPSLARCVEPIDEAALVQLAHESRID
jgi:hypothetical protein